MALARFDTSTSQKQAQLAREEKDRANGWGASQTPAIKKMDASAAAKFQGSKSMQDAQRIEESVKDTLEKRDKNLMLMDPTWLPEPTDFKAPKAFQYDKFVNYYGVLGIPDMSTQEGIKQAYKRLSLIYHPDKTAGMQQEGKDKHAAIFIELKNAYMTLLDNPTRRQYDADRIREQITCDICKSTMKKRPQFWGYDMSAQMAAVHAEKEKGPSVTVEIPISCRLEKIVYGGDKVVRKVVKTKVQGEWQERERTFRVAVRAGAPDPVEQTFHGKGDEHEDRLQDHLKYILRARPHGVVERDGRDLVVARPLPLPGDLQAEPHLTLEVPSVQGRHVLVWGRNPFFRRAATGDEELRAEVAGQGLAGGALRFRAVSSGCSGGAPSQAIDQLVHSTTKMWHVTGGADKGGILVRTGKDTGSPKANPERLSTGALVEGLELDGDRLKFAMVMGNGPATGWVSIKLPGKELVVPAGQVWEVTAEGSEHGVMVNSEKDAASLMERRPLAKGALVLEEELDGERLRFRKISGEGPEKGWVSTKMARAKPAAKKEKTRPEIPRGCPPALCRRIEREVDRQPICELQLTQFGAPVRLYTKPSCEISFYSNLRQAVSGQAVRPRPAFAVVLSAGVCSKKRAAAQWEQLKSQLAPLLQASVFGLLAPVRRLLPRPLASKPVFGEYGAAAEDPRPVPWERLGEESRERGDLWLAVSLYSRSLDAVPADRPEELARLLSLRAGLLAEVGYYEACLADAKRATELTPEDARAWRHVGLAGRRTGTGAEALREAVDALSKAVELEPTSATSDALFAAVAQAAGSSSTDAASEEKSRGNEAMEEGNIGLAVAAYTSGLGLLSVARAGDGKVDRPLLSALLLCNRSAAFARLGDWDAAIADGRAAAEAKRDCAKPHARLGVALLGKGLVEEAYLSFAIAARLQADYESARQGQIFCLKEMLSCRSREARARRQRGFHADSDRPRGSTRIFAISDVHFDHKCNQEWCFGIDGSKFQEDVLIVAGDMGDNKQSTMRGLQTLRAKFRRVFFVPGCHDCYVHPGLESGTYPDSIAKMLGVFEACDRADIDLYPAPVCSGVFVVPLQSWYHSSFDEKDPLPDGAVDFHPYCKWPIDKDEQVPQFMTKLNDEHLKLPLHGTVVTFSHCLPRRGLPFWAHNYAAAKSVGCLEVEEQLRKVRSKVHVYGLSHRRSAKVLDDVLYVNMALGLGDERVEASPPLMMVFDGKETCSKEWGTNGVEVANPSISLPSMKA